MPWRNFNGVRVPLQTTSPVRPRFSLTSDIISYRRCRRQYGFFGNDGYVPAQTLQIFYGTIIHQVLDRCHRHYSGLMPGLLGGEIPSDADVEQYFGEVENALRTHGIRPVNVNIRNQALQVIQIFNKLEGPGLYPRVVDTEYRLESDRQRYIMRGVVDVLADATDAAPGDREIWDYKGSNRPDASSPILNDYIWQMCVYAELYRVRTGAYPRKAILYFINELRTGPGEPPPTQRPMRAVYEVDFSDSSRIQDALREFDTTATSIMACKSRQNWAVPDRQPDEGTCDICDIRWSCTYGPSRPRMPL
jgi:putative RecB family exonuclease